jgi:hypothetical protein
VDLNYKAYNSYQNIINLFKFIFNLFNKSYFLSDANFSEYNLYIFGGKMRKTIFIFIALFFLGNFLTSCQSSKKTEWTPPKLVKEWEIKAIKPGLTPDIISMTVNKNGVFVLVSSKEVKYVSRQKTSEMNEEELKREKFLFGKILSDEERKVARGDKKIETDYYGILHYDFEGNFIRQLPDKGIEFKNPIKILTDSSNNIYTADYKSNEVIKFNPDGVLQNRWRLLPHKQIGEGFIFKGVTIDNNDHVLIVGQGDLLITPKLFEYDTNGELINSKELKSDVEVNAELSKIQSAHQMKIERIVDIEVDDKSNIFLLELKYEHVGITPTLIKLNPEWIEGNKTTVVLKNVFDASKLRQFEKTMKNALPWLKSFDSTMLSWIDTGPGLYFASNLFFDGKYLYVLFLGSKPFGIIDAAIYNTEGKIVGYWKQDSRSNMEWYKSLGKDIEVVDYNLSLSQYGESLFIGRTMHIRKGAFYEKSVIQRFDKERE